MSSDLVLCCRVRCDVFKSSEMLFSSRVFSDGRSVHEVEGSSTGWLLKGGRD